MIRVRRADLTGDLEPSAAAPAPAVTEAEAAEVYDQEELAPVIVTE